ncbi:MAG: hypothetical protein U0667_17950 [Chloroflexota bacterium]
MLELIADLGHNAARNPAIAVVEVVSAVVRRMHIGSLAARTGRYLLRTLTSSSIRWMRATSHAADSRTGDFVRLTRCTQRSRSRTTAGSSR